MTTKKEILAAMDAEYRANFYAFFRILDREAMKWGEATLNGDEYKMHPKTAQTIFNRGWALNGCDDNPYVSTFLYAALSGVRNIGYGVSPWRLDLSSLDDLLEERYGELTFDPAQMTDEELADFEEFRDGDKYDFRFAWVHKDCEYEKWEAWHQAHMYD